MTPQEFFYAMRGHERYCDNQMSALAMHAYYCLAAPRIKHMPSWNKLLKAFIDKAGKPVASSRREAVDELRALATPKKSSADTRQDLINHLKEQRRGSRTNSAP